MVTGRNRLEPLGYVTAKILLFLPKADTCTCISHNRALKTGVLEFILGKSWSQNWKPDVTTSTALKTYIPVYSTSLD